MQSLSGLDAAFLYAESDALPMHIGSVLILEGSFSFADYGNFLRTRLHRVPRLRQKLATVPMNIDKPYWVQDPDFNLDNHLHHHQLASPGDWKALKKLASDIFSELLDRDQPLWAFDFVTGVDNIPQVPKGSVAVISRLHHAAFDGQSGANLMGMLFDRTPNPPSVEVQRAPDFKPSITPSALEMLGKGTANWLARPAKVPSLVWNTSKALLQSGYLSVLRGIKMPATPFRAPKTPFNGPVEKQRRWDSAILDLKRVKTLRKGSKGCTVNDVILTICAGALRRYLLEKDALPKETLIAMVPVSTRSKEERHAMGNQVAAMFVPLATDVDDPVRRLRRIHDSTKSGKAYQDAIDTRGLMELAEMVPFGLAGVASRFYCEQSLAKHHKPFFNLVITNVPGPQIPLYLNGHKLLANMGTAPLFDSMGLMITVCSYMGTVSLSPTSSDNLMPDIAKFSRYLRESANELEQRVQGLLAAEATVAEFLKQ